MALIVCSECGKEASSKAAACPNCGAPIAPVKKQRVTETKGRSAARWVKVLSVLAIIVGVFGSMAGNASYAWFFLGGFAAFIVGRFME